MSVRVRETRHLYSGALNNWHAGLGWAPPPAVKQKTLPSLPLGPPPVGMLNVAANPGHLYFGHIFIYLCIIGTAAAAPPPTDAQPQPG